MAKSILNPDGSYKNLIRKDIDPDAMGNPKGTCTICGKEFEQTYYKKRKMFSAFDKCHSCKKKKVAPKTPDSEIVQVNLEYTPHSPGQWAFHNSTARFRVIDAGIRWGKDRSSTMESIRYFLACLSEKRPTSMIPSVYWWIIAPTERMAKQNWNELKRYFPKELIVDFSNSGMTMQTVQGGVIEIRSAYDPESLVGVGLDIVTITEAARIQNLDVVWANVEGRLNSPGRGLNGKGGIGIINSSPRGRNYFYKMWRWGQKEGNDYDPMWESWRFETWDNPEMAEKGNELHWYKGKQISYSALLKQRMGESRYNQDYLAKFIAGESKCFPSFYEGCIKTVPRELTAEQQKEFRLKWQEPEPYESYIIAYDPASVSDIPAVLAMEQSTGRVKKAYNMSGLNWNQQYDRLTQIARKYNHAPIAFSKTGHETIEEELVKRGNQCITFNEQGANKVNFINRLEVAVENKEFLVLDDGSAVMDELIREFCDYARIEKRNPDGNVTRIEYCNVEESHDDFVSAAYIAFQAITTPDEALPYIGTIVGMRI